MSDRPDDVPEWAWDEAVVKALEYVEWLIPQPDDIAGSEHVLAHVIARALLKAREEAFEEAAKIAEAHATEASMSQKAAFDRGNDVAGNMFWSGQAAALAISHSILDAVDRRPCTCHPDDNPPTPCARKYAFTECASAIRLHSQKGER